MTWTELAEEQIDRMRMMPDSSQVDLLRESLRSFGRAIDRSEEAHMKSLTDALATLGLPRFLAQDSPDGESQGNNEFDQSLLSGRTVRCAGLFLTRPFHSHRAAQSGLGRRTHMKTVGQAVERLKDRADLRRSLIWRIASSKSAERKLRLESELKTVEETIREIRALRIAA